MLFSLSVSFSLAYLLRTRSHSLARALLVRPSVRPSIYLSLSLSLLLLLPFCRVIKQKLHRPIERVNFRLFRLLVNFFFIFRLILPTFSFIVNLRYFVLRSLLFFTLLSVGKSFLFSFFLFFFFLCLCPFLWALLFMVI